MYREIPNLDIDNTRYPRYQLSTPTPERDTAFERNHRILDQSPTTPTPRKDNWISSCPVVLDRIANSRKSQVPARSTSST